MQEEMFGWRPQWKLGFRHLDFVKLIQSDKLAKICHFHFGKPLLYVEKNC